MCVVCVCVSVCVCLCVYVCLCVCVGKGWTAKDEQKKKSRLDIVAKQKLSSDKTKGEEQNHIWMKRESERDQRVLYSKQ